MSFVTQTLEIDARFVIGITITLLRIDVGFATGITTTETVIRDHHHPLTRYVRWVSVSRFPNLKGGFYQTSSSIGSTLLNAFLMCGTFPKI
ncbi:hypothetical protein HanIR_Chr17g0853681 [Helianthus annuus]|nr:hypothetical protein HanIR_Chr17g0853681 [Helianthus annuus]